MKHYRKFRIWMEIIATACEVIELAVILYALYIVWPLIPIFD